ncbi:MAG: S8 family serine peptidase, partial [Coriobacteriaceae bacterium]|nr:S8 family serine peptidase [Coriobacteriaceae bacterium]
MPTVAEKFRAGLRLLLAAAAIACCVCCLPGCASFGSAGNSASISAVPASADAYVPGELVVGVDASRLGASRAADDIASLGFDVNSVLLHAPNGDASVLLVRTGEDAQGGSGLAAAAELVGSLPGVSFVQPNYRYATMADSAADAVGDPDAARQYYLDSWVDSHGANVAQAWEVLGSGSEVDVAVLDTGMYSMADYLDGSLVQNDPQNFHQEFDAGNLDMADARDFVHSGDGDLLPLVNEYNPTGDDNGHGTHVSGIIAAGSTAGGKGAVGMAGVSPFARIIPCKVFDAGGEGDTADIVRAYEYLMSGEFPNLKVVNLSASLSFSADEAESEPEDVTPAVEIDPEDAGEEVEFVDGDQETSDEALHQAIKQALDSGIVTVCAAGNESSQEATYPGDYDECVCVVALDENGGLASYSNVNENKDIAAPGSGIYSAWATQADSYAQLDGTSQATAIVSGVLAMMFSAKPDLAANDAKQALYDTAWKSVQVGNGALDAGAALQLVKTGSFTKEDDPTADDPAGDNPT